MWRSLHTYQYNDKIWWRTSWSLITHQTVQIIEDRWFWLILRHILCLPTFCLLYHFFCSSFTKVSSNYWHKYCHVGGYFLSSYPEAASLSTWKAYNRSRPYQTRYLQLRLKNLTFHRAKWLWTEFQEVDNLELWREESHTPTKSLVGSRAFIYLGSTPNQYLEVCPDREVKRRWDKITPSSCLAKVISRELQMRYVQYIHRTVERRVQYTVSMYIRTLPIGCGYWNIRNTQWKRHFKCSSMCM